MSDDNRFISHKMAPQQREGNKFETNKRETKPETNKRETKPETNRRETNKFEGNDSPEVQSNNPKAPPAE
jgi:hypothetical protein